MSDLADRIATVNAGLTKVRVFQRNDRLYIEATLPPKPPEKGEWKQRQLSTGLPANAAGLRIAKARALEVEGQLLLQRFDWSPWLRPNEKRSEAETVGEWLAKFEEHYWQTREKSPAKLTTWNTSYQRYFRRLNPDLVLTESLLKELILQIPAGSCTRKKTCIAYQALARFAGMEAQLGKLGVGYKATIKRDIPLDSEIERMRNSIQNPAWQWVFGMIATYGLRPHEVFHLDCSLLSQSPGWLEVLDTTKTQSRSILPLHSRWHSEWRLWEVRMPALKTEGKDNRQLGAKIAPGFHVQGVMITPYHLRDAYAIRGSVLGIDPAIVARWMGHGLSVHFDKYHKFITKKHFEEAWSRAMEIT